MKDPTGHVVDYNPGEPPDWDEWMNERTPQQLLVSIAQLLTEELATLQHIGSALSIAGESGGEERLPSITIEDMAKGDPKIVSKSYEGRPLTRSLVDQHLDAHAYAHRMAAEMAMAQWQATVDGLRP
jgi:hypothetical protein